MTRVLFVVSAADGWTLKDGTVHPTGFWAEELVVPHQTFVEAGWDVDIATPRGKAPTVDRLSLGVMGGSPAKREQLKGYLERLRPWLERPLVLADVDQSRYDLVFYPGGHGPMEDLAHDPVSGAIIAQRLLDETPLALLCHAPAAVFAAKRHDGTIVAEGRRMTAFSDLEEKLNLFARKAKWTVQAQLEHGGVRYEKARFPMQPHVVVDGALYTGQNPQSSAPLTERLVQDLNAAAGVAR